MSLAKHPTAENEPSVKALRYVLVGKDFSGVLLFPAQFVLLLALAAVLGFFLHRTAYGRYWYAIGHNELAAKYAGVNVDRQRTVVYVICSALAGLGSVLYILYNENASPTGAGSLLELYAITGAVLGGCSLRGGEGTVAGMFVWMPTSSGAPSKDICSVTALPQSPPCATNRL